jgi:hypothetical protein
MSGLLVRFGGPLAKMVFRDASSKQASDLSSANGSHGFSRTRIDRSCHLSPFAAPAQPAGERADRLISQAASADATGIRAPS